MTWSINWDSYVNLSWSIAYRRYLDTLITSVDGSSLPFYATPTTIALRQNFPNPFNPSTTIGFSLAHAGHARLMVYDLLGRRVATLLDGEVSAGDHEVRFEKSDLASGVYLYILESGGRSAVGKMAIVR